MPYPFTNNPLNGYLIELRNLRGDEYFLYKKLADIDGFIDNKKIIIDAIHLVQDKISGVRKNRLPSRDFDVFMTSRERLVNEYQAHFPQPVKPPKCNHPETELRLKVFKDNTRHVWRQCLVCGRKVDAKRKTEYPNWEVFPLFDNNLEERWGRSYAEWCAGLNKFLGEKSGDITDHIPVFDYDEFDRRFKALHPKPISVDNCPHYDRVLTMRHYNKGGSAVVEQCLTCGKHCKSLSKSVVGGLTSLPLFDDALEASLLEKTSRWYVDYHDSLDCERSRFHIEVAALIASGSLTVVDNSKFGTYYDSEEWYKTRLRILERDDHKCQSCGDDAECVHHITYERLGCENDLDIISLCNECHSIIHLVQDGFQYSYRMVPDEIRYNVKKYDSPRRSV